MFCLVSHISCLLLFVRGPASRAMTAWSGAVIARPLCHDHERVVVQVDVRAGITRHPASRHERSASLDGER